MSNSIDESFVIIIEMLEKVYTDLNESKHELAKEKISWCSDYLKGLA